MLRQAVKKQQTSLHAMLLVKSTEWQEVLENALEQ